MLAQEIINDIKKPTRGGNIVIKLDMTKVYNRVSWEYLCLILKKFGFSDWWVHITNNYIPTIGTQS